jgi:hypothetical protein
MADYQLNWTTSKIEGGLSPAPESLTGFLNLPGPASV